MNASADGVVMIWTVQPRSWASSTSRPTSPAGPAPHTITSQRQIAETATVTSHHIDLLATTLAHRATASPDPAATVHLNATAQAARHATRTWHQTARALREVTTDTRGQLTPAAAEASVLATARETIHDGHQPSPRRCKDASDTRAPARREQAPRTPGPLQQTLISPGITGSAMPWSARLDQASQQLLAPDL
jgi:hypothetical protein